MKDAKEEDADDSPEAPDPEQIAFRNIIYATELERLRYLLRDYLRIRLFKLAEYPQHYLEPSNQIHLSEAERNYVKSMWEAQEGLFNNRFLSALPSHKMHLDIKE